MDPFDDIRPYRDDELASVLAALADNGEFVSLAARVVAGRWAQRLPGVVNPVVRTMVRRRARRLGSIAELQSLISRYVERLLHATSDGMTVEGLDGLEGTGPYLFISNHRDIALDPMLLNYAIWRQGHATTQIAIGDNLLGTGFRGDLMRLNKAFVIRRGVTGAKAQLKAMRDTSAYVRRTLEAGESVWIAQREGRSKDGFDRTEPAILKMLQLAYRDDASRRGAARAGGDRRTLAEWLARVRLTPVAISYEVDPCAALKAHELYCTAQNGGYDKQPDEDIRSIDAGIAGFKGRLQVRFSKPVGGDFANVEELAVHVDRCIVANLAIYPTHQYARARLHGKVDRADQAALGDGMTSRARTAFLADLAACADEHMPYYLRQYANQIENKLALTTAGACS